MRPLCYVPAGGALIETCTRTIQGRLLLRPGPDANEIMLGVLGRALDYCQMDLFGLSFMGSHYHLLIWHRERSAHGAIRGTSQWQPRPKDRKAPRMEGQTLGCDLASLVPRCPSHFKLAGNVSNGGLITLESDITLGILQGYATLENPFEGLSNPRVVRVVWDNPVSPLDDNVLSVHDLTGTSGQELVEQQLPVHTDGAALRRQVEPQRGRVSPRRGLSAILFRNAGTTRTRWRCPGRRWPR